MRNISRKRKKLIRYLTDKIGDCGIECKIDILNIIAIAHGQDIIYEEGTGCRIILDELSDVCLNEIKKTLDEDLDKFKIDFSELD